MLRNDIHQCHCASWFDWNVVLIFLSASKKDTSQQGTMTRNSLAVIGRRERQRGGGDKTWLFSLEKKTAFSLEM